MKKILFAIIMFLMSLSLVQPALALDPPQRVEVEQRPWFDATDCYGGGGNTNPTPAPTSGAGGVTSGKVYILGDSIVAGNKDTVIKGFKDGGFNPVEVDALGGRNLSGTPPSPDGLSAFAADKDQWKDAKAIVIELGTNTNGLNQQNIKTITDQIKQTNPSAKVYWVTSYRTDTGDRNAGLNKIVADNAGGLGYSVIDWFGVVKPHEKVAANGAVSNDYLNDNAHPNPTPGLPAFVQTLVAGVKAGGASTTPQPATTSNSCQCSVGGGGSSGPSLGLVGKDNEEKLFNYFNGLDINGKKLTAQQAAGILGNLYAESGYSPTADNGGHHGIAQWDYQVRLPREVAFAKSKNLDPDSLEAQAQFITEELKGTHAAALNDLVKQSSPEDAAISFLNLFEGAPGQNESGRKNQAHIVYEKFKDKAPGQSGTGQATGSGSGCGAKNNTDTPTATDIQATRTEMIDRLYKNSNFQPTDPSVKADIDSGAAQDAVVKLMLQMVEQYNKPVKIMLVKGSQAACLDFGQGDQNYGTYTSSHWYGLAVDVQAEGTSADATNLTKWLYKNRAVLNLGELEHDPVIQGTSNMKFGSDYQYPPAIQKDHHDHIHAAVKGTGTIGPGCTPKPGGEKVWQRDNYLSWV